MCSFQKCRSVPLSAEKPVSTSSIWDQQCLSYLCNCLIASVYNVHRFAAVTRGWLQWERTAPDSKSTEAKEKVLLTPWIMESCLCYTNFWAIFVAKKQKQLFEGNKGFVLIFANCNEYFCEIFANENVSIKNNETLILNVSLSLPFPKRWYFQSFSQK